VEGTQLPVIARPVCATVVRPRLATAHSLRRSGLRPI
jgi:hypothetical protein